MSVATRYVYNVRSVKEKKFITLDLGSEYSEHIGNPESKFSMMLYGEPGSGKSVYALRFANYFAENIGKVLYNSHEERVNQTLKNRIEQWNINSQKLYFGNAMPFEVMIDKIQKNHYRLVVIDSVQYMDFTYEQLIQLRETFKLRNLSLVLVSFGSGKGKPKCNPNLHHAMDIKVYFKNGCIDVLSRYLTNMTQRVRLYKIQKGQEELL